MSHPQIRAITAVGVLAVASCGSPSSAADRFGEEFRQEVMRTMAHWDAPGVVMSVVKNGEVLLQDGFGTTRAGGSHAPNSQTLSPIQSVTKPITSIAVGMLVDDGVLDWDEPVKSYIPEFSFGDPFVAERVTLRDLLAHRSGLPIFLRGGLWREDLTGDVLLRELATAEPEQPFRDFLYYSNVGLGVVGEVIRRQTGISWSDFVRARIFEPLGMSSSFADPREMVEALGTPTQIENLFMPAFREDGQVRDGQWRHVAQGYCPAGCVVTTAVDMTQLMRFVLNRGMHNGTRLLSEESLDEALAPHTIRWTGVIGGYLGLMSPVSSRIVFGMGWGSYEAFGRTIYEHPGSGGGSSVMAIVPSAGLGVFVSTNASYNIDSDRMVSALKFLAIETALGEAATDWVSLLEPESQ